MAVVTGRRGSLAERLTCKVDRTAGPEECHPFTGYVGPNGYGWLRRSGESSIGAHVVAYEAEHGPVPPGHTVGHTCHDLALLAGTCQPGVCVHRACCNGKHLEAQTQPEQMRTLGTLRTHCSQDHEYTESNTYREPKTGYRQCRTCRDLRNKGLL